MREASKGFPRGRRVSKQKNTEREITEMSRLVRKRPAQNPTPLPRVMLHFALRQLSRTFRKRSSHLWVLSLAGRASQEVLSSWR